ncbi:hypothetical protein BCR37DRAFT_385101 [Protomyces lactucae-debilis]|uniref:Uncharacterized protein n=1 Tax=Protomyces lactucae-debilis TaxID=2754530 RepID=A0A1Y2FUZ9_PROLT|nr:uncharacterized protein BCR37DRAFT_385101 [Protomyces lactucae-debilis]ORY87830.1 hypothetical protein BCR37DRAFT_385101 [Protomyces lactucae-debilis]
MIGVLLCANCASLASIVLLMTSAAYIYYTAVLCLLLTAMAFASLTAFIMTLNPPYKRFSTIPPSTPETEAHIPADESLCHNCLGRQRPSYNGTPVNSHDSRTLSSYYSPSGHQQKAFSILDSKSVAEFLFDEDHSLAAPAFPKTMLSVDGTSEGSHDMIPLHMVNWSSLRASESEQVSSGGLSPRLKAPSQSHSSTVARFARPKTSTFDYETRNLGIELPTSTIDPSDESCMTALDSTHRDSLPTRQGTGVHLNIQEASGCTLQQPIGLSGARLLPLQGEPSPAVRAKFLDAPAVRRPTSVRSRTSEAFMEMT